jgi:hypothetical protein
MNGVSTGIPGVEIRPGTHLCAFCSDPTERDELLFPFLREGIRVGEKCLCYIEEMEPPRYAPERSGHPAPPMSCHRRSTSV